MLVLMFLKMVYQLIIIVVEVMEVEVEIIIEKVVVVLLELYGDLIDNFQKQILVELHQ